MDIDLTKSETRTLVGFGTLYSFLILVIISVVSFIYFDFQKDLMLQKKRQFLQEYSNDLIFRLKDLHINFDKYKYYPRDEKFNSAIYDSDKNLIFSTLKSNDVRFDEVSYISNNKIHFIKKPESYYLGAKYIVVEIPDKKLWLQKVKGEIALFASLGFMFLMSLGYFISKQVLKPMRDSFNLLDRFIKDTTHELNTPIATILTNIEMIDKQKLDEKSYKKLERVNIAAKTISNIYEDLTFLTLNNKIISQNRVLNISNILYQRIEYFKSLAKIKKIQFEVDIKENISLLCDEKKFSKLVDNLLSNAIKYNRVNGKIFIKLNESSLTIKDTGKGMSQDSLKLLFERYSRFDNTIGGFGIGLNIVWLIAKEYNMKLEVNSLLNKGTTIKVLW